jgi:hypothetical protein
MVLSCRFSSSTDVSRELSLGVGGEVFSPNAVQHGIVWMPGKEVNREKQGNRTVRKGQCAWILWKVKGPQNPQNQEFKEDGMMFKKLSIFFVALAIGLFFAAGSAMAGAKIKISDDSNFDLGMRVQAQWWTSDVDLDPADSGWESQDEDPPGPSAPQSQCHQVGHRVPSDRRCGRADRWR